MSIVTIQYDTSVPEEDLALRTALYSSQMRMILFDLKFNSHKKIRHKGFDAFMEELMVDINNLPDDILI